MWSEEHLKGGIIVQDRNSVEAEATSKRDLTSHKEVTRIGRKNLTDYILRQP